MIKLTNDNKQIINLWQQAFLDTTEDILFFINNAKNANCLGYFNNNELVSMLYLVDCKINDENSKYIYAACTKKSCKKKGYMSKLLNYVIDNYSMPICLIPANNSLIDYYVNRKFDIKININSIKFNQINEINDYLFDGCELENSFILLHKGEK